MHSGPRKAKIKLIEEEIEKTKKIMEKNIDKLLERGEKLNALQDKSHELKLQAQVFNQQALAIKRAESFKNFVWSMVLFGAVIGAGFGLYGLATGYHLAVVPVAMAIGAGLAYALTWPISAMFKLYQKASLATSDML
ncbi:MAG TPA: synaptobrevin family protein, partial [Candidatus Berkiella sp.]|nr:synaptobrevin family protein [Candidatus Berkiella sp.]